MTVKQMHEALSKLMEQGKENVVCVFNQIIDDDDETEIVEVEGISQPAKDWQLGEIVEIY